MTFNCDLLGFRLIKKHLATGGDWLSLLSRHNMSHGDTGMILPVL